MWSEKARKLGLTQNRSKLRLKVARMLVHPKEGYGKYLVDGGRQNRWSPNNLLVIISISQSSKTSSGLPLAMGLLYKRLHYKLTALH